MITTGEEIDWRQPALGKQVAILQKPNADSDLVNAIKRGWSINAERGAGQSASAALARHQALHRRRGRRCAIAGAANATMVEERSTPAVSWACGIF